MTRSSDLFRLIALRQEAERLIGTREWFLLSSYGKLMDGANAGSYVSGLDLEEQLELVRRLVRGETVSVHLMHRHRSGNTEISSLRSSRDGLLMVFADREVLA